MNLLKKYNQITLPVILTTVLLVMFMVPINALSFAIPSANGGEVFTAEDFVYALGGDEVAYNDGNVIILKSDLVIHTPIIIKSGEYIIQGSGCHISFSSNNSGEALIILDGTEVTLILGNDRGSDDHPSLTLDGGNDTTPKDTAIKINDGTLNIYTGTLIHNFTASPIHMVNGAINMYGGVITNNSAECGGAFHIENGVLTIRQGTISDNTAIDGGAVYAIYGNVYVISPIIHNNMASNRGGAFWIGKAEIIINNGSYQYNEAESGGFIHNFGILTLGGGTYAYNKAVNGGVVENFNELYILNMNNTTMTFNEAEYGAAIYNVGYCRLEDAQITYNTAYESGGGIANYGELIMVGGSISMNESNKIAGGIANFGKFEMYDGSISSNKADSFAQGIFNADEMILGEHCFISFNNDVSMGENATVEVTSILTANTPIATLTLPEDKLKKDTQIVMGNEEGLISASEKIAITNTGKGTWSLDTDGKLIYESEPLALPYQIVISISALVIIGVILLLGIGIKKRKGSK